MHGKFPAAQWVEHCTANAVRVRMEILYRGTCRFVLFFPFYLLFLFQLFFQSFVAIPMLYQSKMLAGVSVGFPPLISKFTLSKCILNWGRTLERCWTFFFFFFCGFFLSILWKSCTGGLDVLFFLVISFNYFFFEAPLLFHFIPA